MVSSDNPTVAAWWRLPRIDALFHPLAAGRAEPHPASWVVQLTEAHTLERRTFIALVSGGLLAAPLAAEAQQAGKVQRVGYVRTYRSSGRRSSS
jgi:hypothetical protein